jgi:hypothetical protein
MSISIEWTKFCSETNDLRGTNGRTLILRLGRFQLEVGFSRVPR